jgi:hypothetical protein
MAAYSHLPLEPRPHQQTVAIKNIPIPIEINGTRGPEKMSDAIANAVAIFSSAKIEAAIKLGNKTLGSMKD